MRFGHWRGAALALALTLSAATGLSGAARADGFGQFCTIPREVQAVDVRTGEPYLAPPIPYGHYAKKHDFLGCAGMVLGSLCGLTNMGACGGSGCNSCGGSGCNSCGGSNPCGGNGLGSLMGNSCGGAGGGPCQGGSPMSGGCRGLFGRRNTGGCSGTASTGCFSPGSSQTIYGPITSSQSVASPQGSVPCTMSGCKLPRSHFHRMGRGCNACGGNGCAICQDPGMSSGNLCSSCHGAGCGNCGGRGLAGCGNCGGRGCSSCLGTASGLIHGLIAKALHKGEIKYFVGPGGPVPITPGYVPYVVTTRSPRDFFAFPPFSDMDP
jgi:hypothetical protein